jgi:hypothetical protein
VSRLAQIADEDLPSSHLKRSTFIILNLRNSPTNILIKSQSLAWLEQSEDLQGEYPIVPLDPPIADKVPEASELTGYDCEHLASYLRLLDADAQGADWAEVNRTVLHIDFAGAPERARPVWESHLTRAKWIAGRGYRDLLKKHMPH